MILLTCLLQCCSHDGSALQETRSMAFYNIACGSVLYLHLINVDNLIRAGRVVKDALASWFSQGARRKIYGIYGTTVEPPAGSSSSTGGGTHSSSSSSSHMTSQNTDYGFASNHSNHSNHNCNSNPSSDHRNDHYDGNNFSS